MESFNAQKHLKDSAQDQRVWVRLCGNPNGSRSRRCALDTSPRPADQAFAASARRHRDI
jgi:hypothetical protein